MASLEQYAQWLVNNQDKKGTPDFETVANAYRSLRSPIEPPAAPVSTQPAGFSLKDIGTAFGQGAVGSAEAITNVAGAGNVASQYLGGLGETLGKQYSPERQAEMQRQQERMKKAEQSGSTWEEIKAGVQNIYEAPLQSVAQGLGSFVPYVPAIFAGPVAAALGLSGRAVAAANVVAKAYAPVVGTAQGAGSVKGAIYDAVYKAEKESGFSEEEARQKADAAQEYTGKNLDQIALGGGLGYVASRGGIEKFLTREGREKLGEKALLPRVGGAMLEESLTEGAQGGQERLAQNIALQRTGRDVPTFQGVAGQAAQEAIIGGLTAGPVAAISGGKSKEEIEQERLQKERDAFEEQRKAFIAQQEKTEEQLQVPKTLALPAPSREIKPVRDEEALANPLGNITQEELGPEVTGYVNKYRQENNLPPLQSYSIEDVKDAMTQVNPEGEKGALSSILAAKTGFSGEETYTPQDVVNAAIEKNIAYETVGFQDFLQRTTGDRDLNTMTPPQLYSAFKALSDMKRDSTGEQLVLPEGSNASRFTQDQYKQGQAFVTQQLATGEPLIASPTREALKGVTGLKTDRDVHTLLQTLIKNEDLNVAKVGDDYQITPTTPTKDARAPLPKGFSIQEGTFAEGERPAGYEITPEGRGKPLTTVDLEEEVAPKIERLTGLRQQEAAKMLADVNKYSGVVKAGQSTLDGMEARGLSGTEAFAKEKANQARREDILGRRIKTLMDRIEEMSAPLKSKPVGTKQITTKKHTLYKDGKALGTFPSRIDAEASMLSQLSDTELDALASDTRFGGITDRAVQEKERRQAPAGMRVKGTEAGLEKAGVAVRATPEMLELEKTLVAALSKFGLKDVALKVVRAIEQNAEGSYTEKLVKIAFDAANPIRTMRHEAIHALKELGFFTKDQWRVLENKAKTEWIQTYLAGKSAVYDGKQMSRLDAYKKMGLSDSDIIEEAIADAFADFDVNKAPPGLMMALLNKLRNFFKSLRQALTGAGFESAEDIFGKVETGKLESQIDKAEEKPIAAPEKKSLQNLGFREPTEKEKNKNSGANFVYDVGNGSSLVFTFDQDNGIYVENRGKTEFVVRQGGNRSNEIGSVDKFPDYIPEAIRQPLIDYQKSLKGVRSQDGREKSVIELINKIKGASKQPSKLPLSGESIDKKKEKLSLYGEGVPLSTRGIMDRQTVIAQQELGLNTEAVRNRFNNVREIANALNRYTKVQFGVMDQNALTSQDSTEIAKAIADEVAYQLRSTSKTGTGLGWYSNNYPKAVRRLAERFPELGSNEHAQSVFSALVAVTSNGEKVTKNIDNAIKLYAKLRDGKPLVAMGNRRATALQNNLMAVQNLLNKHGTDFKRVLLEEITVKEMNAKLREMGEKSDGSYLADTVVPAAAIYFGPKLGAFYANLSGSEGYLTMDLWWTRSINRMRGLLMPKATEASIAKFRDMMDQPSATRDEVIAATIPLRNKYEEYGWMTELEHLAKSKEPAKKVKKDAWFAKAKREAGDAYDQLLFEHKLEKMANTIYKNEFEMLEEAPFTATDRKFMYDAARKAQQLLRNEGINLTLADIQAALWYYEKRLYEKLSGRKADDIGYEEAIIAQAGQGGGRARPSVVFSEQPDSGDGPAGEVRIPEQVRGKPAEGEKFSLRDPIGLYSELENKIEAGSPKAPAASWKAYINSLTTKGVKPEEIEWSGVNDWLDLQKGTVTKDALLAYLKEGGVRVEETVLGEKGRAEAKVLAAQDIAESIQAGLGEFNDDAQSMLDRWRSSEEGSRIERQSAASLEEMLREAGDNRSIDDFIDAGAAQTDATRYGQYTLPGGNNYREVLLTLPAKAKGDVRYDPAGDAKYPWAIIVNGKEVNRSSDEATAPDILQEELERAEKKGEYKSSHWKEPNVLAHIRVNDRTDAEGSKVLFVEELQSDWGQEGKKKGFASPKDKQNLAAMVKQYDQLVAERRAINKEMAEIPDFNERFSELQDKEANISKQLGELSDKMAELRSAITAPIPTAPFVTKTEGWLNLALKRVMVMAAEGGYGKVAFINGDQSADRYDLSKQVDYITYRKEGDSYAVFVRDHSGGFIIDGELMSLAKVEDTLGKEIAENMSNLRGSPVKKFPGMSGPTTYKLEGVDLKVGGEGMKTFYDTIVPMALKKLLPKVGGGQMQDVQIGQTFDQYVKNRGLEVVNGRLMSRGFEMNDSAIKRQYAEEFPDGSLQQPGFDVTPAMKQKVETTGLPRFSLREAPNTPEFKRWFGDSKVVDKNGKPLVVYHGTSEDFSEFIIGKKANRTGNPDGFYFTPSAEEASDYAGKKDGGNVMPVYVSIKNPFLNKSRVNYAMLNQFEKELKNSNPTLSDSWFKEKTEIFKDRAARENRWFPEIFPNISFPTAAMTRVLEAGGYDGFKDGSHWIAIKPTQIKSATGNIGTYDAAKPDIRYSLRESVAVDKNGKPLELYHATYSAFDKPKINYGSDEWRQFGFHVGPLEAAQNRLDIKAAEDKREGVKSGNAGANIIPVYLDIRNPLRLDENRAGRWGVNDIMSAIMEKADKDGDISKTSIDLLPEDVEMYMRDEFPIEAWLKGETDPNSENFDPNAESRNWSDDSDFGPGEKTKLLLDFLKTLGYDSIVYKNEFEGGGDSYIALNANQVKSQFRPEAKFSLRDVKSEIESLPNGSKIFTAIKRTTTTREEEGFVERITSAVSPDSFSRFRAQALDRYNQLSVHEKNLAKDMGGIERLADSNAHAAALMSDLHAGVTAQVLGVDDGVGGVPVYDKGYTTVSNLNGTVKGPMDIFKQLAAYGDPTIYQAYQFWSAAKRGKRLLAEGKEENITQQDLAFAKELEKKYPEFVSIQKEWIKFNNGLVKYMVDTGVISEEMSKEWTKYSDYLPFYRQLDGEKTAGPNIFQSISGVKPPKKLKGSEAPLADFLETVVRNTHAAVQAGMKNVAAQRAGELAVQVGIGEKLDHLATGADIITALEKGKQVAYRVGDPLFVDAVKSLNIPELPFMSFLTAPANLLRNLVTKDPGFMLANLMRDSISAYVTSGANIKPMIDTVQNFTKAAMNNSPEFEVLKKAGVVGGYDYSKGVQASTESFAKRLRKRAGVQTKTEKALSPVTGIWDFLEKGTEASDAATRIAVYKATLKATGNEAEALLRSLEIMNFNRKGSSALVRIVTAGVPFLNARMQGLDVLYRAGIRPFIKGSNPTEYEKAVQRTFFVRGAMLMGISLMYAMAVKDDPEYEAQEEETKDNNWLITDLGIRIPTPFEVGFIFKTVPERIYRWAFSGSDTGEEFADSMKRGLVSTFAFNPVPQTLLPVAEAITNYSTFTMRPIVGQNLQSIDPRYQVGPSTSVMAEKLGEQLGVSPMKIDHLYKGYTGTMGMYLVDVMDTMFDLFSDNPRPAKRFEQMPVLKRFLVDPDARGNVTAYYAFKHSVDEAVRTVNFLSKRLDEDAFDYEEKKMGLLGFKQYVSGLDKQMTSLQDEATMIRSSGMPPKEKRDALLEIARIQNEIVSDIREIKKMAKEK